MMTPDEIVAGLAASEPFDGEYGFCTICLERANDGPYFEDVPHSASCVWVAARQLLGQPTARSFD